MEATILTPIWNVAICDGDTVDPTDIEYFRCDSPNCQFVTDNPDLDTCPHCRSTMFVTVEKEHITPLRLDVFVRSKDRIG